VGKSQEIKKLDAALSKYVRSSNADDTGRATCWTCGVKKPWKEMDCGHFMSRSKYATRWLYDPEAGLTNVQPQCKRCNMTNGGQQFMYGKRLDEVYGAGTADRIVAMSNQPSKHSIIDIVRWRKEYEGRMKE